MTKEKVTKKRSEILREIASIESVAINAEYVKILLEEADAMEKQEEAVYRWEHDIVGGRF